MALKLDALDLQVLSDLLRVLRSAGQPCFLIGAGARRLMMEDPWELSGARATLDWDFAVRVESWSAWDALRERLTHGSTAAFRVTNQAHRLRHTCGRPIDLVPFGALESTPGRITWPDGTEMSVHAFGECSARLQHVEITPGVVLDSASVPSLAVLKLFAYLDRRARGETKDIQDLDWLLRNFEHAGNEDRVHAELLDVLIDGVIEAEDAGALLLGRDAALIHSQDTLAPLHAVLREAIDPYSRVVQDILRAGASMDDRRRLTEAQRVVRRLEAFALGLGARAVD
jgi:predicted nucleotidyltransferase